MVQFTHSFEVEVTFEGDEDDGLSAESIRLITGRDWKTKSWVYSEAMDLPLPLAGLIEKHFSAEAMEAMREALADRAADIEQQKADDRWSERGMDL
jgi:hypothetical protein